MMCGGITLYNPLVTYGAKGKRVGIVGLGGLGHFGVLFAKALGAAEVVVISRTHAKEEDAKKLGADRFIATADEGWDQGENANTLDFIVSTVSSDKMPLSGYLNLLKIRGSFVQVGAPEDPLPSISAFTLLMKNVRITGSGIGSTEQIKEMLEFAANHGVKPWTQEVAMKDANKALVDFEDGLPRYRFVLKNENYKE